MEVELEGVVLMSPIPLQLDPYYSAISPEDDILQAKYREPDGVNVFPVVKSYSWVSPGMVGLSGSSLELLMYVVSDNR